MFCIKFLYYCLNKFKNRNKKTISDQNTERKYKINTEPFSKGGYGKLYKGTDIMTKLDIAIKELDCEKNNINCMICEVNILRRVGNCNLVVKILDSFVQDNMFYIIQEYIEGSELYDIVIKDGVITEDRCKHIFYQLIQAVQYCHSCGVTHRDIKLDNILIDAQGNIKLIDFGLSHLEKDYLPAGHTLLYKTCGSRSYIAPEIHARIGYYGPPVDIWSCGICLFTMLYGFYPFTDAKLSDWRYQYIYEKTISQQEFSLTKTILSFYKLKCSPNYDLIQLLDNILVIDPIKRSKINDIFKNKWFYVEGIHDEKINHICHNENVMWKDISNKENSQDINNVYSDIPPQLCKHNIIFASKTINQ